MHRGSREAIEEVHADRARPPRRPTSPITSSRRRRSARVDRAVEYATLAAAPGAPSGSPTRTPPLLYERALDAARARHGADDRAAAARAAARARARRRRAPAGVAPARATLERAAALARELDRPEELARRGARRSACSSVAGVVDEPLIELLEEALDAVGDGGRGAARRSCSAGSPRSSTGSTPPGARTTSASRRSRWPGASATPGRARPSPSSAASSRARVGPEQGRRRLRESGRAARPRQAPRRPRARAARARLPAPRPARARRHPRRRRRPRRDRAARARAAPAAVPLARAAAAGDAGADRRPLRRRRALAEEALAGGERAEEPVAAQFYAIQIALLRRLRRSPEDRRGARGRSPSLARARRAFPGDPGLALLAGRDPRRARPPRRGAGGVRAARRATTSTTFPLDPSGRSRSTLLAEDGRLPRRRPARRACSTSMLLPYDGLDVVAGRAAASLRAGRPRPRRCWRRPTGRPRRGRAPLHRRARDERADGRPAVRRPDPLRARAGAARARRAPATASGRSSCSPPRSTRRRRSDGPPGRGGARRAARGAGPRALDVSTSIDFMIEAVASERPDIAAHAAARRRR